MEVVVALFVLGVALTGIVRSLGYGVGVAGAAHRTMLARQLAAAAAADLPADAAAALASTTAGGVERIAVDDGSLACARTVEGWQEGTRAWFWIEVACELDAADGSGTGPARGVVWRPGRAALLVAR